MLTLVGGEDSEWFVDSDASLSSSDSDKDKIYRPCMGESETQTVSSDSKKGRVAMQTGDTEGKEKKKSSVLTVQKTA